MKGYVWIILAVLGFIFLVWYQKNRKGASRLDCLNQKCFDKKGGVLPLSECTKIGLIC